TRTAKNIDPTRTNTSPSVISPTLGTDTASECVKFAIVVALLLGLSPLGSVIQAAVCQYRVQRDSVVKILAADVKEKSSKAAVDAILIQDLTAKLSDLASRHRHDIDKVKADHAEDLCCRDTDLTGIKAQYQRSIDEIKLDHLEELSRRNTQISKTNALHQQEIGQVKLNHANKLSLLSVDLRDVRKENAHKQSQITSLEIQLKSEKERREKPQVMRQTMANWDRIRKRDEKHELEIKQLETDHCAALVARELELKGKHDTELAAVVATTEQRVKKALGAELEAARAANRDTEQLRTEVIILQRNVSLLKKELRRANSSTQNHVDFGSYQREAESKAKIEILQTENKDLRKKIANAKEPLRVLNASKTASEKQRCANESDLASKAEVELLKKKVRDLEDLLESAAAPCNGDCAASKAQYDELRAVIRNNRDVQERAIKYKNKQLVEVRDSRNRLQDELNACKEDKKSLLTENQNLKTQLAAQQRLASSNKNQLNLSQIHIISSEDPQLSPSISTNAKAVTSVIGSAIIDAPVDTSPTEPVPSSPLPTTHKILAATKTSIEKKITMEEAITTSEVENAPEENQTVAEDRNTATEESTAPKKNTILEEENTSPGEKNTPNEEETTMGSTAEMESTAMDSEMKDSKPTDPNSTTPDSMSTGIPEQDVDVLPDAAPNDPPADIDECMETSPFPVSQVEQQPPPVPLFSFGRANSLSKPSTKPFSFGFQQNQMPSKDHEMTTAEEAHVTAQTSGLAGAGQHFDNTMTYNYTGLAQASHNHALYDLAMILKQHSIPSQPNTITDAPAPRLDQSTEPVATPSIPTLPTAQNDGVQDQEPASFHSVPGLQTANIGGHSGQAADKKVDGSNASAPTAVEDSVTLAWKNLALLLATHGPATVPSVQSTANTTPYQEPAPIIPIDSSLLPGGVVDQPEPQVEPQSQVPPITPVRKVKPLPTRLRRPANLKPFEYNKDADRDHLLPKSHVAGQLPLIVDLPDGGFSGLANQTSQPQPPPSPPKCRTSSPVKRSSAPSYDPLGKGKGKYSIFDDPTLFEKQPSSSSSSSDLSSDDFEDCEGFGSKSGPSPTNPRNFSTTALRHKSSAPKITEAPTNPSDIDAENEEIYGRDDDGVRKKNSGPSSSHHPSHPASSNHPSTSVEPPRGVDHAGKGKKRSADGSGVRAGMLSHASSPDESSPSPSSTSGTEQRPAASGLPGLGSANGTATSAVPGFRTSTKAELDQVCRDMGIEPDDVWDGAANNDAMDAGDNEERNNNHRDQDGCEDAAAANRDDDDDDGDDDGAMHMPSDAEILEAMRQNGIGSDIAAEDMMDRSQDNDNNNNDDDDDGLQGLTEEQKHYLKIHFLTEEEKTQGREMHKLSLDVDGKCEKPCRWCREMGRDWK
ncbi:MAG: hypothetical protein Q9184_007280, partial [Pyrenodesmia sp. 2 TL-2023]